MSNHVWLLFVVACGNAAGGPDAQPIDAVPTSTCDPSGIFDPPVALPALSSGGFGRYARFSPDELTAVFAGEEPGTLHLDIYQAQRASIGDSFGTPVKLSVSSDSGQDFAPTLSADQLTIVFSTARLPGGYQIYEATRTSPTATFGAPAPASGVQPPNPGYSQDLPYLTGDGQELWFESGRPGSTSTIWRAAANGSTFANPVPVPELNNWNSPVLSADRLTVYVTNFAQDPPVVQVWVAHRSTTTEAFPAPTVVQELGTTGFDPTWLSPDNCRLYLQSGGAEIYVAVRHPAT